MKQSKVQSQKSKAGKRIPFSSIFSCLNFPLSTFHFRLRRGFTLFFATLIGSLLLAIGIAIFNISIKEVSLSTSGRESQFAFYAADTGAECALYWDIQGSAFPVSSTPDPNLPTSGLYCNNQDIRTNGANGWTVNANATQAVTSFKLFLDPNDVNKPCALVVVTKIKGGATTVESRGQNNCNDQAGLRVERGVKVAY